MVRSSAVIVDDETSPYLNLMGCSGENWSTNGTFAYKFGTNAAGDPIGAIDTHQLGTGLGGHDLFTHTETGTNPDLINTGTWTPNLPSLQYYKVKIHLPALGADASNVIYTINPGGSATPWKIRVNQGWQTDTWATIGTFAMQNGGNVVLNNKSSIAGSGNESLINYDVAFDAIAFIPEGGTPGTPIGGPPTVQDEPKGSNPAWVQCGCAQRTAGDPVNTATGYQGDTWTDLSTPGRGEPLDFTRTYTEATADPARTQQGQRRQRPIRLRLDRLPTTSRPPPTAPPAPSPSPKKTAPKSPSPVLQAPTHRSSPAMTPPSPNRARATSTPAAAVTSSPSTSAPAT